MSSYHTQITIRKINENDPKVKAVFCFLSWPESAASKNYGQIFGKNGDSQEFYILSAGIMEASENIAWHTKTKKLSVDKKKEK
jgi:hypothetical protein